MEIKIEYQSLSLEFCISVYYIILYELEIFTMDMLHWLHWLWVSPAAIELKNEKSCIRLIQDAAFELTKEPINSSLFVFNGLYVDMSLFRFLIMWKILSREPILLHSYGPKIGLFCIEIEGLERPYQVFFYSRDNILVKFVVRGATTDQLIATGTLYLDDNSNLIHFTGSSSWHTILSSLFKANIGILCDEFKSKFQNNIIGANKWKICVNTYSNIGHALRNEIGPLLLTNMKLNIKEHLIARTPGPYNLEKFFNCDEKKKLQLGKSGLIFTIEDGIHIFRNCLIPTGSNPSLGIYASYKLTGVKDAKISHRAKKLRNYFSKYDEVVYLSPRLDHKRGICINQELLISSFIQKIGQNATVCNRKVMIVFEKLWYTSSRQAKDHNRFVSSLILKHKKLHRNHLAISCIPRLELHEKLYVLRIMSAFIGAGGANFCTFFDWQGNETPGIIYGDYNLLIKGMYFRVFMHSMLTDTKIAGRYVLFGENLDVNDGSTKDYAISNLQINSGVQGLIDFIMTKHEKSST